MHQFASDRDLLRHIGSQAAPLLGAGGEARVYDLGNGRVARILHAGAELAPMQARAELLREIASAPPRCRSRRLRCWILSN